MRCALLLAALVALVATALAQSVSTGVCHFTPTAAGPSTLAGSATFVYTQGIMTVTVSVTGLADGDYAIHVHQAGDITDLKAGETAGPHYSSTTAPHGCPETGSNRHDGDMGSWTSSGGFLIQSKSLDLLRLDGPTSIIGRAVVIHANGDTCTAQPSGNAGARIGICVIGLPNSSTNSAAATTVTNFATCQLAPTSHCPGCSGTVWLQQATDGSSIHVRAKLAGLNYGSQHGFHIHTYGDLSDTINGTALGVHWNPDSSPHGIPESVPRHRGDLGSIQTYDNAGYAYYDYQTSYIGSLTSVLGRGIVVHQNVDHGSGTGCDATGNSGARLLTCVIGNAIFLSVESPPAGITVVNNWRNATCVGAASHTSSSMLALGLVALIALLFTTA